MERRDSRQGSLLRFWTDGHGLPELRGRVLPVDTAVARRHARLHIPHTRVERDALIAATALVHAMTVAMRHVADFEVGDVALLNPLE